MSEPLVPLISLLGEPGAACEGDDCMVDPPDQGSEQQATPDA